jgi:hypothetical protein
MKWNESKKTSQCKYSVLLDSIGFLHCLDSLGFFIVYDVDVDGARHTKATTSEQEQEGHASK